MARHISVHRIADLAFVSQPPDDVNSPQLDIWEAEANRRCVYENPLGSEDAVRRFWSEPAGALRLPLLASIYNEGFDNADACSWQGSLLDLLEAELRSLEGHWPKMVVGSDLADLLQRGGYLRDAIRAARACDGCVSVS